MDIFVSLTFFNMVNKFVCLDSNGSFVLDGLIICNGSVRGVRSRLRGTTGLQHSHGTLSRFTALDMAIIFI